MLARSVWFIRYDMALCSLTLVALPLWEVMILTILNPSTSSFNNLPHVTYLI